jgi:hypothetical protein
MWRILKINTYVNSKLQIQREFYIFMSMRIPIEVLWVVILCICIRVFVRWKPQVNPKCLSHSASLYTYNAIPHIILRESPN